MTADELRTWIAEQQRLAYQQALHLARGDISSAAAGFSRAQNGNEAAGMAIVAASQRIERQLQKWERENP